MRIKNILAMTFLTMCNMQHHCIALNQQTPAEQQEYQKKLHTFIIKSILPENYTQENNRIRLPESLINLMHTVERSFCNKAKPILEKATNQRLKTVVTDYGNMRYIKDDEDLKIKFIEYGILHALYRHDPKLRNFAEKISYDSMSTDLDASVPNNQIDFSVYCPISKEIDDCVKTLTKNAQKIDLTLIQQNAIILKSVLGGYAICQNYDFSNQSQDDKHKDRYVIMAASGNFQMAFAIHKNKNISLSTIFRRCQISDDTLKLKINQNIKTQLIDQIAQFTNIQYPIPLSTSVNILKNIMQLDIEDNFRTQIHLEALKKNIPQKICFKNSKYFITSENLDKRYVEIVENGKKVYYYILDPQSKIVQRTKDGALYDQEAIQHKEDITNQKEYFHFYGTRMAARYNAPINVFLNTLCSEISSWQGIQLPHFEISNDVFNDLLTTISQGICTRQNISDIQSINMSAFKIGDFSLPCIIKKRNQTYRSKQTAFTGIANGICEISIPESLASIDQFYHSQDKSDHNDNSDNELEWQEVQTKKKHKRTKKTESKNCLYHHKEQSRTEPIEILLPINQQNDFDHQTLDEKKQKKFKNPKFSKK